MINSSLVSYNSTMFSLSKELTQLYPVGFCNFLITTLFVALYLSKLSDTPLLFLKTFSKCFWQTARSFFSWKFMSSTYKLFLIPISTSCFTYLWRWETFFTSASLLSIICVRFLVLSFSFFNNFTFSLNSFIILPFSSCRLFKSIFIFYNCYLHYLCFPFAVEIKLSRSSLIMSMELFSSSKRARVSDIFYSSWQRSLKYACIL